MQSGPRRVSNTDGDYSGEPDKLSIHLCADIGGNTMTHHRERDGWVLYIDESERENLLTVGGFMARVAELGGIASAWRDLKTDTFNVPADAELKYTYGKREQARKLLDKAGWTQAKRVPKMLELIASMDSAVLISNTMVDMRGKNEPKDYYIDTLFWCIRVFANHVNGCLGKPPGPHMVVIDYPPAPTSFAQRFVSPRVLDAYDIETTTAAFIGYQKRYWEPEPYNFKTAPAYRDLDFTPGLTAAHAKHDELLQVADVVAGCVNDFLSYNYLKWSDGSLPKVAYQDDNFRVLIPSFHRKGWRVAPSHGFGIFPPRHDAHGDIMEVLKDWTKELAATPNHESCAPLT